MAKKKKSAFDKLPPKKPKQAPALQSSLSTAAAAPQAITQSLPFDPAYLGILLEVQTTKTPTTEQISRWLNCPEETIRLQAIRRTDIKFTDAHIEQILQDNTYVKGILGKERAHQLPPNALETLLTDPSSGVKLATLLNDKFKLTKLQFDRIFKEGEEIEPVLIAGLVIHSPEHLSDNQIETILNGSSLRAKVAVIKIPDFTPTVEQIRAQLADIEADKPIPMEVHSKPIEVELLKQQRMKYWESKRHILERADLNKNTVKKIGQLNDPRLDSAI